MKKYRWNTLSPHFFGKKNKKTKSFHKNYTFKNKKRRTLKKNRKSNIIYKTDKIKYYIKIIIIIILFIFFIANSHVSETNIKKENYGLSLSEKMKDYNSKKFAIIKRLDCPVCGLFSFYIVHLGCVYKFLNEGYIPIVDLQDYKNIYNNWTISLYNPWELFFYQPYNYTLEEVKKYAKNINYFSCSSNFFRPNELNIFFDNSSLIFWRNISQKYMPIKIKIINEAKIIMKYLFGNSKNVLGVKIRGTDYLKRPRGHSIQPNVEQVIKDVKIYDEKYKYDFIFFTTEDENIKKKFVPEFKDKIKLVNPYDSHMINFENKNYQHLNYVKNYLFSVVILSNCLDIISSKCDGAVGVIFMTKGFRNSLIYNLGVN